MLELTIGQLDALLNKGMKYMNNQEKIEILKKDIRYRRTTIIIQMIFGLICIRMLQHGYDTMIAVIAAFEITLCLSDFNRIRRNSKELKKLQ